MREVFYDRVNLHIQFDDYLSEICARSLGASFDHEKTAASIAAMKLLRSRKNSIKIWIFCAAVQDVMDRISDAAAYLFGSNVEIGVGDVATLMQTGAADIDMFIIDAKDEVSRISIFDRGLELLGKECFILLVSLFDYCRHDATLTKRSQLNMLDKRGFTIVQESYFCLASRGFCYNVENSFPCDVKAEDQARSIFIFGCQRSGTSLLFHVLNERKDVLISYEANAHILKNRASFLENFNRLSTKAKRPPSKGFFLPPLSNPDLSLAEIYSYFLQHYRFFGDKLAHGPRRATYEPCSAHRIFAHLLEEFPFARIALTCRRPFTNILASTKINGELPLEFVIDNWLSGIIKIIDMLCINDSSALCSFEQMIEADFRPLTELTGLDFSKHIDAVKLDAVTTLQSQAEEYFEAEGRRFADLIEDAEALYLKTFTFIDPATGRPRGEPDRAGLQQCRAEFVALYRKFLDAAGWPAPS